jgi:phospholipase A1
LGVSGAALANSEWQACAALSGDATARLACFDRWARQQSAASASAPAMATPSPPPAVDIRLSDEQGCRDTRHTDLARFWELEATSTCDPFTIRGYRPISLSLITSDSVNTLPTSGNPLNNATQALPYRNTETRIQLSVRTKLAQGLLTQGDPVRRDSLWFGYSQQSYWQLFNGGLSRPFRTTDHEPEIVYVYPTDVPLPGGWRLRYSGIGAVHQSNGQSLPYSRSWNRAYLMTGMERGKDWRVQARAWARIPEKRTNDDNPEISNTIGRAELATYWHPAGGQDTVGFVWRHSLRSQAKGSLRLEWMRPLGESTRLFDSAGGLRLHTQLFSGYGDSLIDYNRRRTVFSVGLSLVDF